MDSTIPSFSTTDYPWPELPRVSSEISPGRLVTRRKEVDSGVELEYVWAPYITQLGWSSEPATAASSSLQPVQVSQWLPVKSVEDPFHRHRFCIDLVGVTSTPN